MLAAQLGRAESESTPPTLSLVKAGDLKTERVRPGRTKAWLAGVKGAESLGVIWTGWEWLCSRSPAPACLRPGCRQSGAEL